MTLKNQEKIVVVKYSFLFSEIIVVRKKEIIFYNQKLIICIFCTVTNQFITRSQNKTCLLPLFVVHPVCFSFRLLVVFIVCLACIMLCFSIFVFFEKVFSLVTEVQVTMMNLLKVFWVIVVWKKEIIFYFQSLYLYKLCTDETRIDGWNWTDWEFFFLKCFRCQFRCWFCILWTWRGVNVFFFLRFFLFGDIYMSWSLEFDWVSVW